jgi:hypothetical protein
MVIRCTQPHVSRQSGKGTEGGGGLSHFDNTCTTVDASTARVPLENRAQPPGINAVHEQAARLGCNRWDSTAQRECQGRTRHKGSDPQPKRSTSTMNRCALMRIADCIAPCCSCNAAAVHRATATAQHNIAQIAQLVERPVLQETRTRGQNHSQSDRSAQHRGSVRIDAHR